MLMHGKGSAIIGAAQDSYCGNPTWLQLFDRCLDCAHRYDIWLYYEESVVGAGELCGIDVEKKKKKDDHLKVMSHVPFSFFFFLSFFPEHWGQC